jgi:hypothetical protein
MLGAGSQHRLIPNARDAAAKLGAGFVVGVWRGSAFKYYLLATGVHSYPSVCHLFSFNFLVIVNLHQPIHEAQIYFVFLSVGNPKTVLKGGYSGWHLRAL